MASKPPVAVYDACVLYPFHLRNVLIQIAFDGLVDARWTDDIHGEWIRNLAARSPGISIERLDATRARMNAVLPEANVVNYRDLIPNLSLPDSDDRHVLAAAIAGRASVIVTWNVKDFPAADLQPHGISCLTPDDFLAGLHATHPAELIDSVARARRNLRKSVPTIDAFIEALEHQGLSIFASLLRRER